MMMPEEESSSNAHLLVEPLLTPCSTNASVCSRSSTGSSKRSRSPTSTCTSSSSQHDPYYYSPKAHKKHNHNSNSTSTSSHWRYVVVRVVASLLLLGIPPFWFYSIRDPSLGGLGGHVQTMVIVWDALLRMSSLLAGGMALLVSVYLAPKLVPYNNTNNTNHTYDDQPSPNHASYDCDSFETIDEEEEEDCTATVQSGTSSGSLDYDNACNDSPKPKTPSPRNNHNHNHKSRHCTLRLTPDRLGILLAFAIGLPPGLIGSMPLVFPSWLWFPASWFHNYRVYQTNELQGALQGICLEQAFQQPQPHQQHEPPPPPHHEAALPLCLSESKWNTLSAGTLSSYNLQDVQGVIQGIQFTQQPNHGLVLAILARDIQDNLPALQQNVQSLLPFFPNHNLAIVIFENDSHDESRHAIRAWAANNNNNNNNTTYTVDLMDCPEHPECQLGTLHRDTDHHGGYAKSKAIGAMHMYRQRVVDHILATYRSTHSHMMVLDMDLAVSLSPLGVLHTLGQMPNHVVASSGHSIYPFGYGSLQTPYDFSAFVPWPTRTNERVRWWHERLCHLMPAGDRWRNACGASSVFLMAEVVRNHKQHRPTTTNVGDAFYPVVSAFNGAVLYPLDQIQAADATYDDGGDGQRCEHIGFHLDLVDRRTEGASPMYVNRKWDMSVDPVNPGGPSGWRAQNAINHVLLTPRLIVTLVGLQALSYVVFVYAITILGMFVVYPLVCPVVLGGRHLKRILSSQHRKHQKQQRRRRQPQEEEQFFKLV